MRRRPETHDAMSRVEAMTIRAEMLARARAMALVAGNESLPWGKRYHAAVAGDDCLDIAKLAAAYIRDHCREG